jgi:hypothetical protein
MLGSSHCGIGGACARDLQGLPRDHVPLGENSVSEVVVERRVRRPDGSYAIEVPGREEVVKYVEIDFKKRTIKETKYIDGKPIAD